MSRFLGTSYIHSNIAKVMWVIILALLIPPLYSYFKMLRGAKSQAE